MSSSSAAAASPSPSGGDSPAFTLQIISPSVAVPQPLNFASLPANTTVRQLREKIRSAIDARPSDQAQRLIHRGRLLSRDDDTMLEIFGEDTIRSSEPQTLHLVLRDFSDARPASTAAMPNSTQPVPAAQSQTAGAPPTHPQQQMHPRNPAAHLPQSPFPQTHTGAPLQNLSFGYQQPMPAGATAQGQAGNLPFGLNPQQIAQQLAQQQRQWMTNMADPQRLQELINQGQRERAAMGLNGAQDGQPRSAVPQGDNTLGRNASPSRPDGTRTVVREGLGPGGQSWRITVNETVTTQQIPQRNPRTGSPFTPADVQNLFRPPAGVPQPPRSVPAAGPHGGQLPGLDAPNLFRIADSGQAATRVLTDAMRRNTSNSSLVNLADNQATQPIPPGVTTPRVPSRTGSAMGTPDPARAARVYTQPANMSYPPAPTAPTVPEVYILSSPEGPRALLMNGNLGTYSTPQYPLSQIPNQTLRRQVLYQQLPYQQLPPFGPLPGTQAQPGYQQQIPVGRHAWAPPIPHAVQNNQQHQQPQGQQPQGQHPPAHGLPQLPQAQPHIGHAIAHPGNVQVRAIAVAQIWPHIWMVIRLLLFVWWFTSPTASWQRWFTVIAIAFTLFLVNTGLLTPVAEQFWTPVRRHMENLLPGAYNHGRDQPARAENAQPDGENAAARGERREPDPTEIAARLVQERRAANGNWLMAQARRLERAGILFLASIAPGVAERHIAHLEAEARAEQQRREAAEAAAAEAARLAAESAQNTQDANEEGSAAASAPEHTREEGENAPLIAI
ncbi:ubiquitin family protein [Seiridium cupressi]